MPYFRVDDNFHAHRKVAKLGVDGIDAIGLWTLAGSWSADQLTDGWVPEYVAARLDPAYEERAAKLVRVGLWEEAKRDGERGWQFHDWSEPGRNPTSEQVKAERAATAERQRRFRDRVKGVKPNAPKTAPEPEDDGEPDNAVTNDSVTAEVTPPVPFPSVPFHSTEVKDISSPPAAPDGDAAPRSAKAKAGKKPEPHREDVQALCDRLVELMVANECKRPTITDTWRAEARRMLDLDKRDFDKAMSLLDWALHHHFWKRNIHSIPTFREKYDRLRQDALDEWERANSQGSNVLAFQRPAASDLGGDEHMQRFLARQAARRAQ